MRKEKKTRTVVLEKLDPDICPMIVGKVKKSIPRMRTVKSKEKIPFATSTSAKVTTCETSGNIMRLFVNLMPVLAAAKEPDEEEEDEENEGDEEDKEDEEGKEGSCTSRKEPETSNNNNGPSVIKSVEQTLHSLIGLNSDTNQPPSPRFVLPPLTQSKPAPECCDGPKRSHTPLPPISLSEQTRPISSNFTVKGCRGDGLVPDNRPWIDNPLFSKSRSPEFRLPDISLSSLEALLQTVTQKLGRKRRGGDEGPWRRVQSDHLLVAVREQRLREKSDTKNRNLTNMDVWLF